MNDARLGCKTRSATRLILPLSPLPRRWTGGKEELYQSFVFHSIPLLPPFRKYPSGGKRNTRKSRPSERKRFEDRRRSLNLRTSADGGSPSPLFSLRSTQRRPPPANMSPRSSTLALGFALAVALCILADQLAPAAASVHFKRKVFNVSLIFFRDIS